VERHSREKERGRITEEDGIGKSGNEGNAVSKSSQQTK